MAMLANSFSEAQSPPLQWISRFSHLATRLQSVPEKLAGLFSTLAADISQPLIPAGLSFPVGFHPREARFWELAEVACLDHAIFPKDTPRWATVLYLLRMHLLQGACLFTVRNEDGRGKIVGTAFLGRIRGTGTGFVSHVGVDPGARRLGLAARMMTELILPEARRQGMRWLVLTVAAEHRHVQDFYRRLGFEYDRREGFEVEIPDGDLPMWCSLEN
ncbi:MAG TPA: N-acetyltransferase [Coleofasciculaceae cyanobacterium]